MKMSYKELESKLNDALNKIKASQEQRPSVVIVGVSKLAIEIADANGNDIDWAVLGVGTKFYSSPVIPPDVAKLRRENAELTRKVAEQQAQLIRHTSANGCNVAIPFDNKELTKLLAEAKSKSVPEGWQLVPKEPTDDMLLAIALLKQWEFVGEDNYCAEMDFASDGYEQMLSAAPQPETDIDQARERLKTIETARKINVEDLATSAIVNGDSNE